MEIAKRARDVSPSLTLALSAKANKMKAEGMSIISFGAGEPDFNTPDYIIEAAKKALDLGITKYTPANGTMELRKAVCSSLLEEQGLKYEPSQIVISNGAKHSLFNALQAVVSPGDEVIIPAPYWLSYPEMVVINGGIPKYIYAKPQNNFKMLPSELEKAITPKTKAIFLNNPSNPTGVVYSKDEIAALAKVLEKTEICIISDEIYDKLSYEQDVYSIARFSEKLQNQTVVINGVSKTYAMTGWRIGYSASNTELAKAMSNLQSHETSNPNSIAQYATVAAITHPKGKEFLAETHKIYNRRRLLMLDLVGKIKGIEIIRPSGAFYVMFSVDSLYGKSHDGAKINSANDFAMILLSAKGVSVIPCESFGADHFIRLSYATSEEDIEKGIALISDFIENLK